MAGGMPGPDTSSYDSDTSTVSHLSVMVSPHGSGSPTTAYCNPFYWQRVVSPETLEALPYYTAAGHPAIGSPMPMSSPHYGCALLSRLDPEDPLFVSAVEVACKLSK